MSAPTTATRNPTAMVVRRAGEAATPSPAGIANRPFKVEWLLESRQDGELTAMRAALRPGTITRWHSHPRGQILLVLAGMGNCQAEGEPVRVLEAGDSVWFPPSLRHWHGASPTSSFSYVSIQGIADGSAADWFEPVASREGQR